MELPKPSRRNTAVGLYVLGEEIGKGAHGQVYKAIDTTDGSMVAVKEIALKRLDDRAREALRLEIDLLTELGAHENVIALKSVVEHDEYVYVVLELAENGSLASLVKPNKFGCLSERLAKVYVTQLLKGLAFLHKRGVVHRDVKGANVLTTKDGVVKIADFGVALRRARDEDDDDDDDDETAKENGMNATSSDIDVQGTPYWMAPEAIEMRQDEKKVGFASDVWSVGCVVVELLTGAPPYFDMQPMPAMFAIVNNKRPPLPEGISEDLRDFLKKCFQRDPRKRPTARDALLHRWIVARREERTTNRDDESKKKKTFKVSSSTSPPPRHYDSEKRHASDASSDDDDSEEEPEWSAPKEMGASSRRRRIVPPSSPFQDAPILDGSDGATPAVNDRGSSRTDASFLTTASLKQSDEIALLETRVLELTNAARDKRPGAAAELARFLAEIQFRDEKTHKKTPSAKTSMFYSPASCDSALERAATADVVTALLADPKTSAAEAADVLDAARAAVAVTTSNSYKKTPPREPRGSRFAASFCLLGGVRWTLKRFGTPNDDPIASLTRSAAAGLISALARNGSVSLRVAASCGALETLSFFLATENAYAGADRNATRHALDAAFALCFPDEVVVREGWMERDEFRSEVFVHDANDKVNDAGAERKGAAADSASEYSAPSSLGFDLTLSPYEASNDGTTSACVASGAAANAGLASALARLLAPLNVAAREESAGRTKSTRTAGLGEDDDPTAATPSGRARDAVAWALGRLIAAPGRAGALARRSVFSASVAATHAFLGVVGSPAMPPRLTRALLKTLHHASRDPNAARGLRAAGATPKLARCLQREDASARESAMRALRNVCLLGESADGGTETTHPSATALEHAVVAGATPHLVAVAVSSGDEPRRFDSSNLARIKNDADANATTDGGGVGAGVANGANGDATHWHKNGAIVSSSLRDVAVDILCAAASSGSRTCRAKLKDSGALEALAELAFPSLPERTSDTKRLSFPSGGEKTQRASYAATRALDAWLEDEPWIVEARLMESDVVQAAVAAVAAVAADRRAADGRTRRRARSAAEAALGATPVVAAVDDDTVDALAGAAARSPRWAGALAAGGVADATLASLEKLVEGVAGDSREGLHRNDAATNKSTGVSAVSVSSAAGAVASRARLLAAVGECDPKAREWIRGAFVVDRLDALAAKCERFQQAAKAWRPAAAAARDASARLRRRG